MLVHEDCLGAVDPIPEYGLHCENCGQTSSDSDFLLGSQETTLDDPTEPRD